jgi:hypothetical protein
MTDGEKKSSGVGIATKIMATFASSLIVFFAGIVWNSYEKSKEAIDNLNDRIQRLEEDKSKWGTLTELHNKTTSMEIEMGRLHGMMEGFSIAVQGGMLSKGGATEKPVLPIIPPPSPLKDPNDLFKNPEDFRKIQQQKYPLDPVQKK